MATARTGGRGRVTRVADDQARISRSSRQAGGHWFEPSTAHENPRKKATRIALSADKTVSHVLVTMALRPEIFERADAHLRSTVLR
jgi:hypothetical protein